MVLVKFSIVMSNSVLGSIDFRLNSVDINIVLLLLVIIVRVNI